MVLVKLDSASASDPHDAVARLTPDHGLKHINVLVANAGINTSIGTVLETSAEDMRAHFEINATAPLLLFQAAWPLLQRSAEPRFFAMSSSVGLCL